jgi:hypothetical protein
VLRVRVTDDLTLDGGTWHLAVDPDQRPIAKIAPPLVPMFEQVVQYLETKPVPRGGTYRRADEARAATAVCLRWGSYFALLADPSRPDAPDIHDEHPSPGGNAFHSVDRGMRLSLRGDSEVPLLRCTRRWTLRQDRDWALH